MIKRLKVNGFRTLVGTEITFEPLTIMIGKNGVGKTSILDALQILGNFARGGVERAFGPPPWSLTWQQSKGFGDVHELRFEVELGLPDGASYDYVLVLDERNHQVRVREERLTRLSDRTMVASYDRHAPPASGTILNPADSAASADEVRSVGAVFRSVVSYELNPSKIELGIPPEHQHVGRDGYGVAGYLGYLKDDHPTRFERLESYLRRFRPETESIEVWSGGATLYWGIRDRGQRFPFPAVHLSWGDRQLVGLLCLLFETTLPGSTIAIEEIDRGYHPSRFEEVIELLSEAAYDGLHGNSQVQIVITTHSPAFLNRLHDRLDEVRIATRVVNGSTHIRPLRELAEMQFGDSDLERPIGEIWEMGLLEEPLSDALR